MAVTKVGTSDGAAIGFGVESIIEGGTDSCVTSFTQAENQEIKELRGSSGQVIAAVFHKRKQDITMEFIGAPHLSVAIGSNLHGTSYDSSAAEEILVDEVTTEISAEGHRTTSVKATGYFTTA